MTKLQDNRVFKDSEQKYYKILLFNSVREHHERHRHARALFSTCSEACASGWLRANKS